jgi:radical SAM superfamily enzyme YgiQ (UPF0313 family)
MTHVLHYQKERRLDDVPAYATGVQLRLSGGPRVYIARSATELAFYFDDNVALHYDLEGRLAKVADQTQFWRRSLSGRVLHTRKRSVEEGGGLIRTVGPAEPVIVNAHHRIAAVQDALSGGTATVEAGKPSPDVALMQIRPAVELAAGFDVPVAAREAEQFQAIYGRVAVLPPDQYNALVLQATEGCSYAGCTFCELYRGVKFRRKSPEEFRQHLRAVVNFHGESLRARRSIFLGEANSLAQPISALREIFRILNEHFELPASDWLGSKTRFDGVSSFMDAFTNTTRSTNDFAELRQAGLRRVYIGLESGDDRLLKWLKKPATAEAAMGCVRQLKEAGIIVGVIVLLGAGGEEFAEAHVRESARVLNEMPLTRQDYIYFSPLQIYPGSQYNVPSLPRERQLEQEQAMRQSLRGERPYLAHYELETFVY